jgi:selT/selW/selH-like putative selenoprotein
MIVIRHYSVIIADCLFGTNRLIINQQLNCFDLVPEHGTQVAIALFLIIPQLIAQFATTGAFEIVVDGEKVIWSKLQEGRFPSADELTNPLVQLGLEKST